MLELLRVPVLAHLNFAALQRFSRSSGISLRCRGSDLLGDLGGSLRLSLGALSRSFRLPLPGLDDS
jgi:hypothetical protein